MNGMVHPTRGGADQLLFVAAVAGLADALFNFFWPGNGIHGTPGALLVVISSALMTAAAGSLLFAMPRWVRVTLIVLILLDIAGTALAAYMLEANVLLATTGIMLIGWTAQRIRRRRPRHRNPQPAASQ